MMLKLLLFSIVYLHLIHSKYHPPDEVTQGEPWPLPWNIIFHSFNHTLGRNFHFSTVYKCDILEKALVRYRKWLLPTSEDSTWQTEDGTLSTLKVVIEQACPVGVPQFGMDENYKLEVPSGKEAEATLKASQIWGALRGLETFSQLAFYFDTNSTRIYRRLRSVSVRDFPRFPHRGVLLDSSRHFLPVASLFENIDLMAQNKFNVFHWHIVDDPAFPYQSKIFPKLAEKGAYSSRHVYTSDDIKSVIKFARLHGIRVVVEFDTPGHTKSWGNGQEDLLCDCYEREGGKKKSAKAMIDPTKQSTWNFLLALFTEILSLFPDQYIHLGGDEAWFWMPSCWMNNPEIRHFMFVHGFGNDTRKLESYYFDKLIRWIIGKARKDTKVIVWQEVLDNQVQIAGAIAQVWKGNTITMQMAEMAQVTGHGHQALLSSCWYLDRFVYGPDWYQFYDCDPTAFEGSREQKSRVLGGEAALWGEMVDSTNLVSRLWPRASAVAERLWSNPKQTSDADLAWSRMHEMRCRMVQRGHAAEPTNGPSFCFYPYENTFNASD